MVLNNGVDLLVAYLLYSLLPTVLFRLNSACHHQSKKKRKKKKRRINSRDVKQTLGGHFQTKYYILFPTPVLSQSNYASRSYRATKLLGMQILIAVTR